MTYPHITIVQYWNIVLLTATTGSYLSAMSGILLAIYSAMRKWLWKDTVDCLGHYALPPLQLALYMLSAVLIVFVVCTAIDRLYFHFIEKAEFGGIAK